MRAPSFPFHPRGAAVRFILCLASRQNALPNLKQFAVIPVRYRPFASQMGWDNGMYESGTSVKMRLPPLRFSTSLGSVYPVFGARVFPNEMSSAFLDDAAEDTRATGNRVLHLALHWIRRAQDYPPMP